VAPDVLDQIRVELERLDPKVRERFIRAASPGERALLARALDRPRLLPHQRPPIGDWQVWLLLAGRGAGKTQACSTWFDDHMTGPPCDEGLPGGHRAAIVAPTLGDAWEACISGPSGLVALNPTIQTVTRKGGTFAVWPSGAEAKLFGTHTKGDVDRLRAGGNRCAAWCEELAAWPRLDEAWEHLDLGLRQGAAPKRIASTTPKARRLIHQLVKDRRVAVSRARTADNPHLHPDTRERLYERYAGTRLGLQELEGRLLEDVEGALWTADMIDRFRWAGDWAENEDGLLVPQLPPMVRIGVGVDPPGGATECGIIVAGLGADKRAYVLDDRSLRASPGRWGATVVEAYRAHDADRVIAETNYGGDMVVHTIETADPSVPVKVVRATRGKAVRAEPVVGMYEKGRVVHVGVWPELEEEQTGWIPDEPGPSPNRMDALVWVLWWLLIGSPHKPARRGVEHILSGHIDPHV
jgi:phage terminase large subunit-like protein